MPDINYNGAAHSQANTISYPITRLYYLFIAAKRDKTNRPEQCAVYISADCRSIKYEDLIMATTNTAKTKKAASKKNEAPVVDQSLAALEASLNAGETITPDASIPGALVHEEGGIVGADLLADLLDEAAQNDAANAVAPAAPANTGKIEAAAKPTPAPAKPNGCIQ